MEIKLPIIELLKLHHEQGEEVSFKISPELHVEFNGDADKIIAFMLNHIFMKMKEGEDGLLKTTLKNITGKKPPSAKVIIDSIGILCNHFSMKSLEFNQPLFIPLCNHAEKFYTNLFDYDEVEAICWQALSKHKDDDMDMDTVLISAKKMMHEAAREILKEPAH